jgi:hypothetical protein
MKVHIATLVFCNHKTSKITFETLEVMIEIACFIYNWKYFYIFKLTSKILSKQYHTQEKYIKDAISRALNEKSLYGAPIVVLSKLVSHLTYNEIVMREFQPK